MIAHDAPRRHKLSVYVFSELDDGTNQKENKSAADTPDGLSEVPPFGDVRN